MCAARLLLPLACMILVAACTSASGGVPPKTDMAGSVSNHFAGLMTIDDPAAFRSAAAERGFLTTENGVVLDIQTRGLRPGDRDAFELPGVHMRSFHPNDERVSAVAATPAAVRAIARLTFVRIVAPSFGATTKGNSGAY